MPLTHVLLAVAILLVQFLYVRTSLLFYSCCWIFEFVAKTGICETSLYGKNQESEKLLLLKTATATVNYRYVYSIKSTNNIIISSHEIVCIVTSWHLSTTTIVFVVATWWMTFKCRCRVFCISSSSFFHRLHSITFLWRMWRQLFSPLSCCVV